jgi:hypothetical protein
MRRRCVSTGLALVCAAAASLAMAAPAAAQQCSSPTAYPGDGASKEAIATWMAQAAVARGIPGELPVMAALVESGLENLDYGDADSVGFFQMRVSIWNKGEYAGYPDRPDLQVKWFLDQAEAIRSRRIAEGDPAFGTDSHRYGEWIADVVRPPAQYRGEYQLRLEEARGLIGAPCQVLPPGGTTIPPVDETGPSLALPPEGVKLGRRALTLALGCPVEQCTVRVAARILVRERRGAAGAARAYRLSSGQRVVAAGARANVRLRFGKRLRRAIAAALRAGRPVRARLRVDAVDAAGNLTVVRRAVRLRG